MQITDFFTSLTTVKYVLDCSNICADAFLAPKLDLKGKKKEEAKEEKELRENEEDG